MPNQAGMSFLSSYNSNFRDWNPKYHGKVGPLNPYLNQSLPLIGTSNYKKDFQTHKQEKLDFAERSKL